MYGNLVEALRESACSSAGIRFLYNAESEDFLSYSDLLREADSCLSAYQTVGLSAGDEVMLIYKSSRDFLVAYWACLLGGIVAVPLSYPENQDDTHKVFSIWGILKKPWIATDDDKLKIKLESYSSKTNMTSVFESMSSRIFYHESIECAGHEPQHPSIQPNDIAFIQFSSGSTGSPKGVVLTHENLLYNIQDILDSIKVKQTDSFLSWKPITHDFGMICFHLAPLVAGLQQYRIPTNTFIWNPVFWFSAVNKFRATILGSPNFGFRHFLKRFKQGTAEVEQWELSCVRVLFNAAEPIMASLCDEFNNELGRWGLSPSTLKPGYGLAEATLVVSTCAPEEDFVSLTVNRKHIATGQAVRFTASMDVEAIEFVDCGYPCKNTEVRITDDERRPLGEDIVGNIEVKGICVTSGYYRNPEATQKVLTDDGWLDTQDLGFLHKGRLVIVGRKKEIIIIGGINYFPHDIEQAILLGTGENMQNKYIACGIPNKDSGTEDLVIFVYYKNKNKHKEFLSIIETVRKQVLESLGLKVAHILPIRQIPKTTSGKVQRYKLVQSYLNGEYNDLIQSFDNVNSQSNTGETFENPLSTNKEEFFKVIIREEVEKILGHSDVDINVGFTDLGLSSVKLIMLQERLEKRLGLNLSSTAVLDYSSVNKMAKMLVKRENNNCDSLNIEAKELVKSGAVAVVGMACRFPGGVNSPKTFWNLLSDCIDPVCEIPEWRWRTDPHSQGDLTTRMGGFLDDIDKFDPLFFGISQVEAEALDPQQRLLLELAWEAFEDAGWNPKAMSGSNTGVFVGIAGSDYAQVGYDMGHGTGPYTYTGTMLNTAAGRISYTFGLQGPCMAIDTACSSSLAAVHQSILQLRSGNCDIALAAGVNMILRAGGHASFSKLEALSPSGRCRSFDEGADGYIRSEGGAVLILKKLEDAHRDGDSIWGIIKGAALNHNGHSAGLTVPNGLAQQKVIRQALDDAGLKPDSIDYLEAHGSGTKLGDPQEINSLTEVFNGRTRPLYIGSVKSNLGHLETAAGLASMCKVLLAMKYGKIPANLHFNKGNPLIPWDTIPLKVVDKQEDWQTVNGVRRAGISSFGISGINTHVVLESACDSGEDNDIKACTSSNLFTLSTRTESALRQYVKIMADWCRKSTSDISTLCRTLGLGRAALKCRLALTVESMDALAEKLEALDRTQKPIGHNAPEQPGSLVFLFTGQGSQYHNMAAELYNQSPIFKEKFDELDKAFRPQIGASLVELVYGDDNSDLQRPLYAQPLIFSIEISLAHYWGSLGIVPDILMGHSIGEYAAACMAGVMSLEDAVHMVAARAEIMEGTPSQGRMIGVLADEDTVCELIKCYDDVSIAAVNAPENITVSGGKDSIDDLVLRARKARIFIEELGVSHPFHSILMRDGASQMKNKLEGIKFHAPTRCLISACTGTFVNEGTFMNAAYWGDHLVKPVLFSKSIKTAISSGGSTFLEIGATATLSGLAAQNINDNVILVLPSLRKNLSVWKQICESMGRLWQAGYDVDWRSFYKGKAHRIENLPHTPYEQKRVWFDDNGAPMPSLHDTKLFEKAVQAELSMDEIAATTGQTPENVDLSEVREAIRSMISKVTGVSTAEISNTLNLFSLGLDSLMLVQLGKNVLSRFHVDIPIKEFFAQLHTVDMLADYIIKHCPVSPKVSVAPVKAEQLASGGLKEIVNRQLAIMEEQLRLLGSARFESIENISVKPSGIIKTSTNTSNSDTNSSRGIKLTEDSLTSCQQEFLDKFIDRWNASTRKSKEYAAKHREGLADWIVSLNFSRSIKELVYPLVSAKSEGSKFWDIDGNEYLDTAIGYGVSFFGHKPDFVVEAMHNQLDKGYELGPQSNLVGEVTELIRELTGVERVAYCNSGTEAVMVALRLARAVSGRDKMVRFITSFHGSFDGVLAEAGEDCSEPMSVGIPQSMVDDTIVLRYGSKESLDTIRKYGAELAAILVEPVQSRNPGLQPREYLHQLRALCTELGIALIFDEMVTGFRIHIGGAQAYFGVEADIVTYGKLIAGGMPIGIVAGKAIYMDAVDGGTWSYGDESGPSTQTTFFAGTFCKHPLTMAACKAVLQHLKKNGEKIIEDVNKRTSRFIEQVNTYFAEAEVPLKAIQFGSMYRFESGVSTDMTLLTLELNLFFRLMMEEGIYIWERRTCFFSAAHTDGDAEKILKSLKESVRKLRDGGFKFRAVKAPKSQDKLSESCQHSFELSSEERRVYIMSTFKGGNEAYQVRGMLALDGILEIDKLKNSFKIISERHDMLRSSFRVEGSKVVHYIDQAVEPEFIYADLRKGDSLEKFEEDCKRPFDLGKAPLWRYGLLIDEDGGHKLLLNFHHIIVDGPSIDLILKELEKVSNGVSLKSPSSTYRDYVIAEKDFLASDNAIQQRDWWLKQLKPLPPALNLPVDSMRPEINTFKGASRFFTLETEILSKVNMIAKEYMTTPFMVLLAAWSAFLGRISSQSDFCIGIPWDRRNNEDFDEIVGMFAQTLVLRLQPSKVSSFEDFLSSVKEMCLGAYENAEYPLDKLLEALDVPRNLGRNPLFDVMFIYENGQQRTIDLGGVHCESCDVSTNHAAFDLTLEITERDNKLFCSMNYSIPLFSQSRIDEWIMRFGHFLNEVINKPSKLLGKVRLLSGDEEKHLLSLGSGPKIELNDLTAGKIINRALKKYALKPSVWFKGKEMDYSELDERATILASVLVAQGIGKEDIVGVLLPRSPEMIVAILAVLKAGSAWLPLDLSYPIERIQYMLNNSQARLILCEKEVSQHYGITMTALDPDDAVKNITAQELGDIGDPKDLAYLNFTSGSTGLPKGVQVEQGSLANFLVGMARALDWVPESRIACLTTVSFDIFILESLLCLSQGGCIVLADEKETVDPVSIARIIKEGQVDYLQMTPTRLQLLLSNERALADVLGEIKTLIIGGEPFPNQLLPVFDKFESLRVFNVYGPTETCVWSTCKEMTKTKNVSIGSPIDNTQVYILDDCLHMVPPGVEGDLWISGLGVARGYINNPELTAERFVDNPFGEGKMYRTGDRALWNGNELECRGRDDGQVKLRGYRIELGEIEQVLKKHPAVANAAVTIQEFGSGNKLLVSYFQLKHGMSADKDEIKAWLAERLPEYMLPAYILELPDIPQTQNGKVDRNSLPKVSAVDNKKASVEPKEELDTVLQDVWKKYVGDRDIGIHDSFFDIGGNSFSLVIMQAELDKLFPGVVSVADLFANPTIARLRQHITGSSSNTSLKNEGVLMFTSSWFGLSPAEGGSVFASLEVELVLAIEKLGELYRIGFVETVMSLFALYLHKTLVTDIIPVWMLRDSEKIALLEFNFERHSDFGEVLLELSSSMLPSEDFRLIHTLGLVSDSEYGIRVGVTSFQGTDVYRLFRYFDLLLVVDKETGIAIEYSGRLDGSALEYHLKRFIKMINLVIGKIKVEGESYE